MTHAMSLCACAMRESGHADPSGDQTNRAPSAVFGAARVGMAPTRTRRRAALLLEVLVALTILVAVLGVLSGQLVGGLKMVANGEEQTRASQLADRIMALLELDPTTMQRVFVDQQSDGEFGDDYPGWYWRVFVEPTPTTGLGHVTIEVLHQPDASRRGDVDDARVVRRLHMLKADPGRIDLEKDFGVEQEMVESVMGQIPIPGLDPTALDPQQIVSLDPAELMQLLPTLLPLLQQFGGGGGNMQDLLKMLGGGGDLQEMLGGMAGGGGRMGGADMLRNMIQQQLGDRVSEADLDRIFGAIGGTPGGGRGGRGGGFDDSDSDGGDGPPRPGAGGMNRDQLRDMIKGVLGDRVGYVELDAALQYFDEGGGGNRGNGGGPGRLFGPGMGGRRGEGGTGGDRRGGNTIRDFNDRRNGGGRGRG